MTKRILIVEDQEDNRQIMQDLLESAGYEVIIAVNGHEGVAKAQSDNPDLVLMDIQLPGLDGYEAARRIREAGAAGKMPIIAVTSYALGDDRRKALEAGCDDYVAKPVSPRDLLSKVRSYVK
jgi:two-component system cell cycle response regulator DivK